ncbi:MAG: cysteine rich repeat-containing protein [Beijerinckiaceae bacterium]
MMARKALAVFMFGLGLIPHTSVAQNTPRDEAIAASRVACRADYQKYCSDVQQGQGRIIVCLKKNFSQLTPDCRKSLVAIRQPRGS